MGKEFKDKVDFCADADIPFPVKDFVFVDSDNFPPVFIMVGPVPIFFGMHIFVFKVILYPFSYRCSKNIKSPLPWTMFMIEWCYALRGVITCVFLIFIHIATNLSFSRGGGVISGLNYIYLFNWFMKKRVWRCSICGSKDWGGTLYIELQSKGKWYMKFFLLIFYLPKLSSSLGFSSKNIYFCRQHSFRGLVQRHGEEYT